MGTGTTGAVAKKLGRNFIGIEKDKKYFKVSEQRIKNTNELDTNFNIQMIDKKRKKNTFGYLVESGLVEPGLNLFDYKKKYKARSWQMDQFIVTKYKGQFIRLVLKFKVCQVAMDGLIGILILREN